MEFSSANTGTLINTGPEETEADVPLDVPTAQESASNNVAPEDPAIFAAQSEPAIVEADRDGSNRNTLQQKRFSESIRVNPTASSQADEPEWARPVAARPTEERAESVAQSRSTTGRPSSSEIRLAAHQEPSSSRIDAAPKESAEPTLADTLKIVDEQIGNEEFLPAHRTLSKLYWNQKEERAALLPRLNVTARAIFFEPRPHLVEPYVVQANDQLRAVAAKYQLSWEYVGKLNRTDPRRLQPGQKLKVLKGPFAAVVDLKEFALTVHLQGYFVKRYEVGIGKDGASPVGKFTVMNKVENPQYTGPDGKVIPADDPTNPLGERWIDLGDSYGIHGTIDPDSIGRAASRGCIRMRANDVIEVYNFLVKGSEVVIRN